MRKKLLVVCLIVFSISLIVLGNIFFIVTKNLYINQLKNELISNIDIVKDTITLAQRNGKKVDNDLIDMYSKESKCKLTFIDEDGNIYGTSNAGSGSFKSSLYDLEISMAEDGYTGSIIRDDPVTHKSTLYVAEVPIMINDENVIIRAEYTLDKFDYIIKFTPVFIVLVIILTALIFLIINYFYLKNRNDNIKELTLKTKLIAKGHFNKTVETQPDDLTGELAENFNLIARTLNNMIKHTNEKNSRINAILCSMDSGIIIFNNENEVTMFNPAAEKLTKINKKIFFKNKAQEENKVLSKISDIAKKINNDNKNEFVTINTDENKTLDVSMTLIENKYKSDENYGVLVAVKDVTEIKKLEKMRMQFVSNVSHEIRTPLTCISGFVETLKSCDSLSQSDKLEALDIIDVETERLKKLISDLLRLSEIESDLGEKREEKIDIENTLKQIMILLKPMAKNKDISIDMNISSHLNMLTGNENWFRQMIINLCQNAIKYTPKFGKVLINAEPGDEGVIISVKDNGIGIPEKDIPRVFERFYRVDKARNSKVGGTGLGLAIVKHIVIEFGGKIEIKSKEGEGSEFTVTLPYNKK